MNIINMPSCVTYTILGVPVWSRLCIVFLNHLSIRYFVCDTIRYNAQCAFGVSMENVNIQVKDLPWRETFATQRNQPTIHTQRDNLPEVHRHTHSAQHISSYSKRDKGEQTHTCAVQTASSTLAQCHNYTTELNWTKQSTAQHSTYMPSWKLLIDIILTILFIRWNFRYDFLRCTVQSGSKN